jgi:CNT family concentrative nucleoside transporter
MIVLHSFAGLLTLTLFAWVVSENRGRVKVGKVAAGLALQLALAVMLLKVPPLKKVFLLLNSLVISLQAATTAGTSFVFGYLGGAPAPFAGVENPAATTFILALQALPLVLVVSALTSLLFYWRVLPVVVRGLSWLLQKSMGIGGALGLATAANIFVGMIEAPLFIRPYLMKMTRSELFTVMTCGMATIAGTVMVLYASFLDGVIPNALAHILIASIISAPAAITIAGVMVPETSEPTSGRVVPPQQATSSMDAVTKGTLAGLELLLNIVAMLVVLVALVHLVNLLLGTLSDPGERAITLQLLLGYVMAPVVWLMGIPWSEATTAGSLMGTKTILNEFLAYLQLIGLPEGALSERSRLIMIYAMCGFANFGSLGIMIGGLGTMATERRDEIVALGLRSIVSGTIATCMTGAVVGIVYAF